MQQSGRAIMQMIERDARMAGFEYLDEDANMTYGKISSPLIIKDSGNKCCDELTVIYDYVDDVLDWKGRLVSSSVNRIRVRYWTEAFTSKKGDRFRLYKQKDILGKSNALLTKPIIGNKEVMADFVEDLQIVNIITTSGLFTGSYNGYIRSFDPVNKTWGLQEDVKNKRGARIQATALAFGPDGLLYIGNAQGYLRSFDPVTKTWGIQEMSKNKRGQTISLSALAFGPDGLLYTGSYNGYIRSFDPVNKTWGLQEDVKNKRGARIQATALAFGPDGLLYIGNAQGYLRSFDPVTKTWGIQEMSKNKRGQTISLSALAFKIKRSGQESLVTINLTLRTRNPYGINKEFRKKDYHGGNFDIYKTDNFKRDTFSSKVLVRNMML